MHALLSIAPGGLEGKRRPSEDERKPEGISQGTWESAALMKVAVIRVAMTIVQLTMPCRASVILRTCYSNSTLS